MGALVRSEWRSRPVDAAVRPARDDRIFALVVDDSITVRRVTQRLLERNGMRVMTAKDGVDAMSLLQDHMPDVILLDIEMPRMDGYEVAAHVRSDPRLADVPIIMITSRVGDKHRARAIELGVDDYLGKPYQESQLLDAIEPLVLARRQQATEMAVTQPGEELYCLLVPLREDRLLLPRGCVSEVINYQAPTPMEGAPAWYLGTIAWGGRRVPLVSFEAACGRTAPRASGRTRIVVMQAIGSAPNAGISPC